MDVKSNSYNLTCRSTALLYPNHDAGAHAGPVYIYIYIYCMLCSHQLVSGVIHESQSATACPQGRSLKMNLPLLILELESVNYLLHVRAGKYK